jgi:CBS-domain-containing membrane protein
MTTMQRQLRAADLMTLDPVVVAFDAPIEEAERLLASNRVSGLPVTDAAGALVGVISQTDLVHLAKPDVRSLIRREPSGIRVGEVMTSPAVTVGLTTSLVGAARIMRDQHVHRVVVIDECQRPLGVLSAMDFVTTFADGWLSV